MDINKLKQTFNNFKVEELNDNQKFWLILWILCFVALLWAWWAAKFIFSIGMLIYCGMLAGGVFGKK